MTASVPKKAPEAPNQSYQNVSRETFLSDEGRISYKAEDGGFFFDQVRSADFLVQFGAGQWRGCDCHGDLRKALPMYVLPESRLVRGI
jgi:hypothetical protein